MKKLYVLAFTALCLVPMSIGCAAETDAEEVEAGESEEALAQVPVAVCLAHPPCAAAVGAAVGVIARATQEAIKRAADAWARANPTDAQKLTELDLSKCSLDEHNRRYKFQKDVCNPVRSCRGLSVSQCASIEFNARAASNCAYARRSVQLCYKNPDFDGHQTQINQMCTIYDGCDALYRHFECNTGMVQRPSVCGR